MSRQKAAKGKQTAEVREKLGSDDAFLPVKMEKNTFVFCMEFERSDNEPTTAETRRQIPTNGVRMGFVPINAANMKKAMPENYFVIAECWLGTPEAPGNIALSKQYGKPLHVWQDEEVRILREAMKDHGERVWWNLTGEQDNNQFGREAMFKSKAEAYAWVRDSFLTNKPGHIDAFHKRANFPLMKNRYKVDFKKENIAIQSAMCFSAHYLYEWGAKFGWMERNCWLANNQIAVAFMRGAARQYDGYWGLDFSPWGEPTTGYTQYNEKGMLVEGLSESLHLREWLTTFYAGANLVLAEASHVCAWIKSRTKKWKLSPHGECAKKFGQHTLVEHPDRGTPHVPVALMLEHNHGWDPREHRLWNGLVAYSREDQMLDNFFNLAFPGQEEGFYVSKWMPDGSPQFPWKDEKNIQNALKGPKPPRPPDCAAGILEDESICLRKMMADGFDPRPYERGMLVNSQWGDSFDVVLENCPLEVLCQYKLIILLGGIQLTPELEKKLRRYVEQGGELVVNVRQVSRKNEKFLGSKLTGKFKPVCMFYPTWKKIAYNEISYIDLFSVESKDVEVLERTGNRPDSPATLVKRKLGKGAVYFSAVSYMQSGDSLPFAEHCKDFLDWLISRHLLVKVRPDIQYLVNTKGSEIIVTLINNYKDDWAGEIIPVKKGLKLTQGTDLWSNKALPAAAFKEGSLKVTCPAFGFKVLSFGL